MVWHQLAERDRIASAVQLSFRRVFQNLDFWRGHTNRFAPTDIEFSPTSKRGEALRERFGRKNHRFQKLISFKDRFYAKHEESITSKLTRLELTLP